MKIYAKQISPENQESPLFLGEEFWPEGIILDGNRDYTSRTISAYDDIKRYFDDMAAAWENDGCYYSYEETAEGYRSVRHTCKREYNIAETLREYGFQREDGKAWTTKQRHEWRLLMESGQEADDEKLILAALRLITGKEWNTKTINGCCQGDWQRVFMKWKNGVLKHWKILKQSILTLDQNGLYTMKKQSRKARRILTAILFIVTVGMRVKSDKK